MREVPAKRPPSVTPQPEAAVNRESIASKFLGSLYAKSAAVLKDEPTPLSGPLFKRNASIGFSSFK